MFLHRLKIRFRNLCKNPLHSLIHIIGLGIALTCVIMVSLFVKDEFSFDRFHSNANRIYRLTTTLNYYWMRLHPGHRAKAIELIQQTYMGYAPEHIAQYSFLEDDNTLLYRTEKTRQQIINYASMLSILICCIGLFGLAHLSAGQRTKEIGVRKVLGASTLSIVKLFSKDVVRLVVFAALIAFPLSWIAMNNWLQDFAYRIPLSPWLFVAAGLIAVLIAMATVTFQAIRSAIANPVKSLRTE